MDDARGTWTIAELAEEFGVTHRAVRFYEDRGLLTPERRGLVRVYHPRDRVRLALVLRGKRLGFDLEQIRRIVDMYDEEPGHEGQLRYLLERISARRADLEQRRRDIEVTLAELDEVEHRCRASLTDATGSAAPVPAAAPAPASASASASASGDARTPAAAVAGADPVGPARG